MARIVAGLRLYDFGFIDILMIFPACLNNMKMLSVNNRVLYQDQIQLCAHARTLKHLHMPLVVSHVTSQLCNKINIRINKKKFMYFMDSWVSIMVGYA